MDNLYNAGIYTVLATPSGGKPAWMAQKYPEIRRVDSYDVREHQGVRENHCMSSPVYREKLPISSVSSTPMWETIRDSSCGMCQMSLVASATAVSV